MDGLPTYYELILLVASITFLFCYVIAIIVQSLIERGQSLLGRIVVALVVGFFASAGSVLLMYFVFRNA